MKKNLPIIFCFFFLMLFAGCEKDEPSRVEVTANMIKGTWTMSWSKVIQYTEDGKTYKNEGPETKLFTFDGTKINISGSLIDFPYTIEEKNGKLYINAFDNKIEITEMTPEKMNWFYIEYQPGSGQIVFYENFVKSK